MKEKKRKERKVKMPLIIDFIFTFASKLYLRLFYKVKIDRTVLKKQKRGCLLIYNHYSNKDHYVLKASTNYRRVTFVLASTYFFSPILNRILTWARAISKDQFKPDISAIRNMRKALDLNQIVAIAPAGQTTIDGNSPFISRAIVKFIRMGRVDVLAFQERGVYLTFPKWRRSKRKCQMSTRFVKVIEKEEIEQLSDDEIYQRVCDALDIREYEEQLTLKRVIKGKNLTSGLEYTLTRCPKCGMEHVMVARDNHLECLKCGYSLYMDKYGLLHSSDNSVKAFKNIPEYYAWQKKIIGMEVINGRTLETKVKILSNMFSPNSFEDIGEGIVILSKDQLALKGIIHNQEYYKEFHLEMIPQLPFDPGRRFEIPNEDCVFRLIPDNPKDVIDFVQVVDYFNDERIKNHESHN